MKNWKKEKLGDVCEFVRGPFGGSLKKNIFKEDGFAVYEQQHAIYDQFNKIRYFIDEVKFNEMKRFELNSGDLIMSCSGTMGKIAIVPDNIKRGIINQALLKLSPSSKVSTVFLKLWMQSENFQESLEKHSKGAAIKNVASVAILKKIEIPLPPLPEQQRIVAIIDEVFEAIAMAKANAEQNLKNAKELFESYLQKVFETKGEGWEEKTLGEIATFRNGMNFTKSSKGEKINIVGVKDFQKSFWVPFETLETVTLDGKLNDLDLLKEGDILAVRSNGNPQLIGRTLLASEVVGKVSHSGFTIRIRLNAKNVDPVYLCNFLKITKTRKILVDGGNGVGIKSLNQGSLAALLMPIPSVKQQQTIVQKIDALSSETKKLEAIYQQKINDLEELKKSVLQKAFAGELKEDLKEHFAENA